MDTSAVGGAQSMLEFIAEHTSDVFIRVDRQGRISYVSPAVSLFGYAQEDLIGTSGIDLIHPEDQPRLIANSAALFRGEVRADADRQYRLRQADGTWLWIEGSPRIVFDAAGQPAEVVTVFRDVTRRREAEAAMRDSEARYRTIVEQMKDVVIQTDTEGRFVHVSPSVRALGYEPGDLLGRSVEAFLHPEDAAVARENRHSVRAGEAPPHPRHRVRRVRTAAGEWAWLEGEAQTLRDEGGGPTGQLLVLRNVTEQRIQADLFEAAFNHAPVAMTLTGLDGRFLRVNPASCRILGMTEAEHLAVQPSDITHPDDLGINDEAHRQLMSGEIASYESERRFRRKDGAYVWTRIAMALVRNADGSPKHFISHAQDLTAHRAAEAALRASEVRYRVIAEQTRDIIAMSDRDAKITYLSPSIRQLGFEPEDLVGKTFAPYVYPGDAGRMADLLKRQTPGAAPERIRWRARHQVTGDWVWMESMPTRLWDPETGASMGFLDIVRDVSHQVAQEQALAQARADAEAAAAVKSQFLANMSHEIRTPLTAVLGYSDILAAAPGLDATAQSYARRIAGAGSALLAIVNDILDFSKLEAGMVDVRPHATDIGRVVEDTLALFEGRASEKGLTLSGEVATDLPPMVMLDSDRLRQILVNLAGNAVKFTERGQVTLRVGPCADGATLRFEIEDTGPGLDAEQCAQLFQRFNQIDGALTRRHGGTGLGLAICKGLAEAMGGEVGVTSTPGQGSIFHLILPLEAAVIEDAPAARADTASIAGLRVLVVDDNATNRELARRILEAFGADVTDADGGGPALTQLATQPVDVVLMDLRMPDLDGREVLTRLRALDGPNQDAPVLAFTADAEVGDGAGLEAFDGVVRKPIDTLALAGAVALAAGGRDTQDPQTHRIAAQG